MHTWRKGVEVDITPFEGFLYQYDCTVCDKKIYRTMMHAPISGILPKTDLDKYKEDPIYNMSPLIISRKD